MGIRHLETFMKVNVTNGFVPVSLETEIKLFQSTNNIKPILLIDLMSLNSIFNRNKIEILCGGRRNMYEIMLDQLFSKLKEAGAELVFFGDGAVPTVKYDTYCERQNSKYVDSITLHDLINDGCPLREIVHKDESRRIDLISQMGFQETLERTARKHGTLTTTFNVECDTEMAEYASRTPAVLAIMADDTDFLIYAGKWRYFSVRNLDLDTLMTKEYSRLELRKFLGLTNKQLIVLSTLGGNDVMKYDDVKQFHRRLISNHNTNHKFVNIANFIKNSLPTKYDDVIYEIGKQILYDTSDEALDHIHKSLNFYSIEFEKKDYRTTEPLLHKCLENGLNFIFSVLKEDPINYSLMCYDLRQDDFPLYFDLVVPMSQRHFGLLLQHKQRNDLQVKIYTQKSHNDTTRPHFISPVYPPIVAPPLMNLIFDDDEGNDNLNDLRFNLLKWLVCWDRLGNKDLKAIPKEYLIDVLVLVVMKEFGIITTLEGDIFMLTIKSATLNMITKEIQYPEVLNSKAYRLAFIFLKLHSQLRRSLQMCGLRKYSKSPNFDGVFFHISYLRFIDSPDMLGFLIKDLNDYRLYQE
ncbi:unnamed protein product [Diamesa hyperborea]